MRSPIRAAISAEALALDEPQSKVDAARDTAARNKVSVVDDTLPYEVSARRGQVGPGRVVRCCSPGSYDTSMSDGQRGDFVFGVVECPPLRVGLIVVEASPRTPCAAGTEGAWNKSAAAVRTDVVKNAGDTVRAEGALVTADTRVLGGRWKIGIAELAIRSEGKHVPTSCQ